MLEQNLNSAVEALAESLETMAFVSLLPFDEAPKAPATPIHVSIAFSGAATGQLELIADETLGSKIVANIMGLETGDPEAAKRSWDALRELANVTCGVLLPKIQNGSTEVFQMAVPTACAFDATAGWDAFVASPGVMVLDADGTPLALRIADRN